MGRPRGSGRGGARGRGRGGAGRGATLASAASIPVATVATVDIPTPTESPESESVKEVVQPPADTEGDETAANSSSDVAAPDTDSTVAPPPVVRGRGRGGRPRGRGRGGRGRGRGREIAVGDPSSAPPPKPNGRVGGPGSRGGKGAYKARRMANAQQLLDMAPQDGAALNARLIRPDFHSFSLPQVDKRVTRSSLKVMRAGQLETLTIEELSQREEQLRKFYREGAQILINQNILDAVKTHKALESLKPGEAEQMEWYQCVREGLVRNEVEQMAQMERAYKIQQRSLDIMRDGQLAKLEEATIRRMCEAVERAVRNFLRSGENRVSELFKPVPEWFTNYVLDLTGHDSPEQVTRGDLIAAFEPKDGQDRSHFDFPQLSTRSNQGLYDRKVLPTRGAVFRETIGQYWGQIAHKFDSRDDLTASEMTQILLERPEGVPLGVWRALEDYQGASEVLLAYATKVLLDVINANFTRIGSKFEGHPLEKFHPQEIIEILAASPDQVTAEIFEAMNDYCDAVSPHANVTPWKVARKWEAHKEKHARVPDTLGSEVRNGKRKRDAEEFEPRKKIQEMKNGDQPADRGIPTFFMTSSRHMDEEMAPMKTRKTDTDRKTYLAVEIPDDDLHGEESDPEMESTYMMGIYGDLYKPRSFVRDYLYDTGNPAQFQDVGNRTSHELRAAEALTAMGMTARGTSQTVQPVTIDGNDDTEMTDESEHESDNIDEDLYDEVEHNTDDQIQEGVGQLAGDTVDKTAIDQPVTIDKPAAIINGPAAIIHQPAIVGEPAEKETQNLQQIRNLVNGTTTDDLTRKDIPVQRRVLVEMENPQELPSRFNEEIANKEYGPESNSHEESDRRGPNGIQAVVDDTTKEPFLPPTPLPSVTPTKEPSPPPDFQPSSTAIQAPIDKAHTKTQAVFEADKVEQPAQAPIEEADVTTEAVIEANSVEQSEDTSTQVLIEQSTTTTKETIEQLDTAALKGPIPPHASLESEHVALKWSSSSQAVSQPDAIASPQQTAIPSSDQALPQANSMPEEEEHDIPGAGMIDFAGEGMFIAPQPPAADASAPPAPDLSVETNTYSTEVVAHTNLRPNGRPREPPRKKRGRPRDSRPLYSFKVDRQKADRNAVHNRDTGANPLRPKGTRVRSIRAPRVATQPEPNGTTIPLSPPVGYAAPEDNNTPPMSVPPMAPPPSVSPPPSLEDTSGWQRSFVSNRPPLSNPPTPAPVPNYGFPPRPQPPPPPQFVAPPPPSVPPQPPVHSSTRVSTSSPAVRYYVGGGRWVNPPPVLNDEEGVSTTTTTTPAATETPALPIPPPSGVSEIEIASQVDEQYLEDVLYGGGGSSEYSFSG